MISDQLHMSVPRFLAPTPYVEGEEGAHPTVFEVDRAIARMVRDIQRIKAVPEIERNEEIRERPSGFKNLPQLAEMPPAVIVRAPPTGTAAGFEERQTRISQMHEEVRKRAETARNFHADRIMEEIKQKRLAALLETTPVYPMSQYELPNREDDDKTVVARYFG